MRFFPLLLIFFASVAAFCQSGRVAPGGTSNTAPTTAPRVPNEPTVKQMFDETNEYIRKKGAEFDAKKVPFSERLFTQAKLEQRSLAAKYAAMVGSRKDLAGDDFYYLGMLHWIAENLDGTAQALRKFIAADGADPARRQTARSIVIVVLAKQNAHDEAEG